MSRVIPKDGDLLLDRLQRESFDYFLKEVNPGQRTDCRQDTRRLARQHRRDRDRGLDGETRTEAQHPTIRLRAY